MIDIKLEVHIADAVNKMFDSMVLLNMTRDYQRGRWDSPDARILRFSMGRQVGHTAACQSIAKHLKSKGFEPVLLQSTHEMTRYANKEPGVIYPFYTYNSRTCMGYKRRAVFVLDTASYFKGDAKHIIDDWAKTDPYYHDSYLILLQ